MNVECLTGEVHEFETIVGGPITTQSASPSALRSQTWAVSAKVFPVVMPAARKAMLQRLAADATAVDSTRFVASRLAPHLTR